MTREEAWSRLVAAAHNLTVTTNARMVGDGEELADAALVYAKACGMEWPRCPGCGGNGEIGRFVGCSDCDGTGEEPKP